MCKPLKVNYIKSSLPGDSYSKHVKTDAAGVHVLHTPAAVHIETSCYSESSTDIT